MWTTPSRTLVAISALVGTLLLTPAAALDQQLYGVNYDLRQGPDWDPSKCKPADAIASDLKALSTITKNVRTYSLADCDVAPVLKTAKALSMTVWLGVWVSEDAKVFEKEVATLEKLIAANLIDDNVVGFNVGSEAVYRQDITADTAIEYLKEFKAVLAKNNIKIPVAVTDIGDILTQYPEIVDAGDVVTANAFPFWEKIDPAKAARHFERRIQPLLKLAKGKQVYITETGWPTNGVSPNASIASAEGAARYMNDFYAIAKKEGWKYYYFAGFDSPYKTVQSKNEQDVEGHFGIFTADGTMKPAYAELTFQPLVDDDSGSSATDGSDAAPVGSAGTDASTPGASASSNAGGNVAGSAAASKAGKQSGDSAKKPAAGNGAGHIVAGASAVFAVVLSTIMSF